MLQNSSREQISKTEPSKWKEAIILTELLQEPRCKKRRRKRLGRV